MIKHSDENKTTVSDDYDIGENADKQSELIV